MKQKRRPRKIVATRVGRRLAHAALTIVLLSIISCSAQQKISVKQQQGDQTQETVIEHGSQIKELSLHFNACSPAINYPQSLTTSKTLVSWQN